MRIERPSRSPDLSFRVYGEPGTAGSKVSGVAYRKDESGRRVPMTTADGRIRTFTNDSSGAKGKAWRSLVADAASEAMIGRDKFSCPLFLEMTFLRKRSAGDYKKDGTLRDAARAYPHVRPDCLKHGRAAEDAMSGIVYTDDALIVSGPNEKVYAERDEPLGVEVRVWALPATVGELRERATLRLAEQEALTEEYGPIESFGT